MNQKARWIKFGYALILLVAAGIGGFFFGKVVERRATGYAVAVAEGEHFLKKKNLILF